MDSYLPTRSGIRAGTAAVLALALTLALAGAADADADPYPDPPPSFPALDEPHSRLLSPLGGQTDRPMLVLYVEFADETFTDTATPPGAFEVPDGVDDPWADRDHMDAGAIHKRFFGEAPSVADYFHETSGSDLLFVPAVDTDDANGGAVNDGVVSITIDENKAVDPDNPDEGGFIDWDDPQWPQQQETLLKAAADHVDFSLFDKNDDGRVTEEELIIVRHDVDPQQIPEGSGGIRRPPGGLEIDGVQIGGSGGMPIPSTGTATNLMTLVHEIGHAAFDMPDTYQEEVPELDIGSWTSSVGDLQLSEPNAWHKMHLGWLEPTVVTESGHYDVGVGEAFVLYDPDRGTDEYFLVENRQPRLDATELVEDPAGSGDLSRRFVTFESYDQGVGSTRTGADRENLFTDPGGLAIWRIDESQFRAGEDTYMELIGPDGTSQDPGFMSPRTWHPDASDPMGERTMEGHAWTDGTPAALAVRDISPSDDVMRVYFDVAGPGVLLDPTTHTSAGHPVEYDVSPDESNGFRIPTRNTGETVDTFSVSFADLPPGWETVADEVTVNAGEEADAFPDLIPAADAPTGPRDVTVVAESVDGEARAEATLTVDVVLDATSVTYTGQTRGVIDEPAGLTAEVTNASDDHAPVDGVEVTFELSGDGGTLTASAVTDADGVAASDAVIDLPPGDYTLTASTERHGKHAPAATTTAYRVLTVVERIEDLRDDVGDAGLPHGTERSLLANLDQALAHFDDEQATPGCNALAAFVNSVEAQAGRHVPADLAEAWTHEAHGIRAQAECGR